MRHSLRSTSSPHSKAPALTWWDRRVPPKKRLTSSITPRLMRRCWTPICAGDPVDEIAAASGGPQHPLPVCDRLWAGKACPRPSPRPPCSPSPSAKSNWLRPWPCSCKRRLLLAAERAMTHGGPVAHVTSWSHSHFQNDWVTANRRQADLRKSRCSSALGRFDPFTKPSANGQCLRIADMRRERLNVADRRQEEWGRAWRLSKKSVLDWPRSGRSSRAAFSLARRRQ